MTTGSKVSDNQFSQVVSGVTIPKLGTFKSKVWSGGDMPPATPVARLPSTTRSFSLVVPAVPPRIVGHRWETRRSVDTFTRKVRTFRWRVPVYSKGKPERSVLITRKDRNFAPKAKRTLVPHYYSCAIEEWSSELCYRTDQYYSPNYVPHTETSPASGWALGLPSSTLAWSSNDDLKLVQKLRSKIVGSDFNAGVFLAEANQSIRMIANSATRISQCVEALKKGRVQKAWSVLKTDSPLPRRVSNKRSAADNWVAMQYGWKPLIDDAEGAAAALATATQPRVSRFTVQSRKTGTLTPGGEVTWGMFSHFKSKRLIASVRSLDAITASGLLDIPSILWEKAPWSFVADWVIPIGSFLSGLNFSRSLDATYVVTTVEEFKAANPVQLGDYAATLNRSWSLSCPFHYRTKVVERTVTSDLAVPLPSAKILRKIATLPHCLNAIALLVQRVSR